MQACGSKSCRQIVAVIWCSASAPCPCIVGLLPAAAYSLVTQPCLLAARGLLGGLNGVFWVGQARVCRVPLLVHAPPAQRPPLVPPRPHTLLALADCIAGALSSSLFCLNQPRAFAQCPKIDLRHASPTPRRPGRSPCCQQEPIAAGTIAAPSCPCRRRRKAEPAERRRRRWQRRAGERRAAAAGRRGAGAVCLQRPRQQGAGCVDLYSILPPLLRSAGCPRPCQAAPHARDTSSGSHHSSVSDHSTPALHTPHANTPTGNFLPKARDAAAELSHIDWDAPKAAGLPLQQLAERFTTEFLRREWFGARKAGRRLVASWRCFVCRCRRVNALSVPV